MIINRDNYEEYFILYNDNELNGELKRQVENFVELNTDLKQEFELIKDLKLDPADQIRFDKTSLYKPIVLNDDLFQPTADQEKLLLYLDNELSAGDRTEIEAELKINADLNKEFKQLSITKIPPDLELVYTDKESLYRKQETVAKVVKITWIRVAVAAAVIFLMGLMWMNRAPDESGMIPTITQNEPAKQEKQLPSIPDSKRPVSSSEVKSDQSAGENKVESSIQKPVEAETEQLKSDSRLANNGNSNGSVKNKKSGTSNTGVKTTIVDPQTIAANDRPVLKSNSNFAIDRDISAADVPLIQDERKRDREIIDKPSDAEIKSDYATEALMSDSMPEEPEFLAQENGARKGAFRGIIRKANRFINKVTNPDTNGPSVKVASFEIALAK